jgi:hypothetical protein
MAWTDAQGERWVTISALTVAGIYGYRRVVSPTGPPSASSVVGTAPTVPPLGTFVTAWAVTFLITSVMASANPEFGGAFAILIATGYFLANAPELAANVQKAETPTSSTSSSSSSTSASTSKSAAPAAPASSSAGSGLGGLAGQLLGG